MPSTIATGAPSLPSDYALSARYAAGRGHITQSDSENNETPCYPDDNRVETLSSTSRVRFAADVIEPAKDSCTSQQARPKSTRFATLPVPVNRMRSWTGSAVFIPTERTRLLHSTDLRQAQSTGEYTRIHTSNDHTRVRRLWEEYKVLIEYTLPVFG